MLDGWEGGWIGGFTRFMRSSIRSLTTRPREDKALFPKRRGGRYSWRKYHTGTWPPTELGGLRCRQRWVRHMGKSTESAVFGFVVLYVVIGVFPISISLSTAVRFVSRVSLTCCSRCCWRRISRWCLRLRSCRVPNTSSTQTWVPVFIAISTSSVKICLVDSQNANREKKKCNVTDR